MMLLSFLIGQLLPGKPGPEKSDVGIHRQQLTETDPVVTWLRAPDRLDRSQPGKSAAIGGNRADPGKPVALVQPARRVHREWLACIQV
jgi:hypothetical protein